MVEVAIRQDLPPVPCIASPVKTSQPNNAHANAKLVVSSIRICSHLSLWRNTASLRYLGLQAHGICIFVFLFVSVPVDVCLTVSRCLCASVCVSVCVGIYCVYVFLCPLCSPGVICL